MPDSIPRIFQDLPDEVVDDALRHCERRTFALGSTLVVEGDTSKEINLVLSGVADILMTDAPGRTHCVARLVAGDTFGEMSFLSGRPASATVRASTDMQVLVLREEDLLHLAATSPRIYHNLGSIITDRLIRANRLAFRKPGRFTALVDVGAPPLLGYALASSIAWHTRARTLLVIVTDSAPPAELDALRAANPPPDQDDPLALGTAGPPRAELRLTLRAEGFDPEHLAVTLDELRLCYDHVLLQAGPDLRLPEQSGRRLVLAGAQGPPPDSRSLAADYVVCGWAGDGRPPRPDAASVLRVPPLAPSDAEALVQGLLPNRSAAGRALGWAARDLAGKKVGLALGAGLERGYAHLGVLRALERAGLEFDYRAGTSIGAIVLGMRSVGFSFTECAQQMDEVGAMLFRLTVPSRSLLSNRGLRAGLQRLGLSARIEDQEPPLAIVAADLQTQREVVLRRGLLWQACLASCALPGIYPPQKIGPYILVDGGALSPVPSNIAADMGADVVISVRLASTAPPPPIEAEATVASGKLPSILRTIMQAIDLMYTKIEMVGSKAATIQIEPKFEPGSGGGLRGFSAGRKFIERGEATAEQAMPQIVEAFPWLRG